MNRRNFLLSTSALVVSCTVTTAQERKPSEDMAEMFDDFEQGYEKWDITGTAFGTEPARGSLPGQQRVTGYHGNRCINTFLNGDATKGRAISRSFVNHKPYITFLIGGGSDSELTALRLLIDGKVVETASGKDDEHLEPRCWNVSRWVGREARFEIVDNADGAWGHILVDDLAFALLPPSSRSVPLVHNYLIVPVYFDDTAAVRPHPINYYKTIVGPQWPGLDHYFKSVSDGRATLDGTQIWNWTRMPGRAISYAGEPSAEGKRVYDFRKLLDGFQQEYGDKFKLSDWYGIFFCPNVVDQFGGGSATWIEEEVSGKKVLYPVGILNPTQGQSVWVHEFSHHFGIGHIDKTSDGSVDNSFSAMAHWGPDYPPYGGIACEQIAFHKRKVGWIAQERITRLVASGDDLTITVERLADPPNTRNPLLVILPDGENGKVYYTVEARKYAGEDKQGAIPCEGIVIHRIDEANKDREASLQMHSSPHGKQANSAWLPGEIFTNPNGKISVEVLQSTITGFQIRCRIRKP